MGRLLRDSEDFPDAIAIAGRELDLDPSFVEKDYWVTQVLRSLTARHGVAIVFKGGTSLSKGYGIIERFSEDVDILVRPRDDFSISQLETRLREMTDDVAGDLGLEWRQRRIPTRGRHASRGDVIVYPQRVRPAIVLPLEDDGVLLEAGYGDGREPSRVVEIVPMLCAPLKIDPDEYDDTRPVEVSALQPVRTLLEKVVLLHHVATVVLAGDDGARHERIGRHYHDVDKLLGHHPTVKQLRDEHDDCMRILGEIELISDRQYGGSTPRPQDGGFCGGPAFAPPREGDLRPWLEGRYDAARGLMPHVTPARWPSFGETLKRINRHADLL
jgi:hypothetical protein